MNWTVWLRKPRQAPGSKPLAKADEVHVQLVHWTGDGDNSATECRVVDVRIDKTGTVVVEHSTANGGGGPEVEHVTRLTMPGWDEE